MSSSSWYTSVAPVSEEDCWQVTETWNKMLDFREAVAEGAIQRSVLEMPSIHDALSVLFHEFPALLTDALRLCFSDPQMMPQLRDESQILQHDMFIIALGLTPDHWSAISRNWMWSLERHAPYLEECDRDNLRLGLKCLFYRAFVAGIAVPALRSRKKMCATVSSAGMRENVVEFWNKLIHDETLELDNLCLCVWKHFQDGCEADAEASKEPQKELLAYCLVVIEAIVDITHNVEDMLPSVVDLYRQHQSLALPEDSFASLMQACIEGLTQHLGLKDESIEHWKFTADLIVKTFEVVAKTYGRRMGEASQFYSLFAREVVATPKEASARIQEISDKIRETGTYKMTSEELTHAARVAWRNSVKCIGRINWNSMTVRDRTNVVKADDIFHECVEHMKAAVRPDRIVSVMTVFPPLGDSDKRGFRFWNSQFTSYAGYRQPDGTVVGDPANAAFTDILIRDFNWRPPQNRTPFDLLPLVIETPAEGPKMYTIPSDLKTEVELVHPKSPAFSELGLKWVAVPTICNFTLDAAGIEYVCNAFNGWFVDIEIARDLWERYKLGPKISEAFGYSFSQPHQRQQAFYELCYAINYSFSKNCVSVIDQQLASEQFMTHCSRERKVNREVPGQWSWIGGLVGSTCPVWHREMREFHMKPTFKYQSKHCLVLRDRQEWIVKAPTPTCSRRGSMDVGYNPCIILYGSETGKAEKYALKLRSRIGEGCRCYELNEYASAVKKLELCMTKCVIVLTSTFGDGGPPFNAQKFLSTAFPSGPKTAEPYIAVLALGSSMYPKFAEFGHTIFRTFCDAGFVPIVPLEVADELQDQDGAYDRWSSSVCAAVSGVLGDQTIQPVETVYGWSVDEEAEGYDDLELSFAQFGRGTVVSNECINDGNDSAVNQLVLNLADNGETYEAGDHVQIQPPNDKGTVLRLCRQLNVDPNTRADLWSKYGEVTEVLRHRFSATPTFRTLLTWEFELRLQPEALCPLLKVLKSNAPADSDDEIVLTQWLSAIEIYRSSRSTTRKLASKSKSLSETQMLLSPFLGQINAAAEHAANAFIEEFEDVSTVLDRFRAVEVNASQLLHVLPRARPRFYSVASIPRPSEGEGRNVTLFVRRMATVLDGGKELTGKCSSYLLSSIPDQPIFVSIDRSHFKAPTALDTPVIMIGVGTAVAPFIAFCEEWTHSLDRSRKGPVLMYAGFRDEEQSPLQSKLKLFRGKGVLTKYRVAYSRISKKHVQNLLREDAAELAPLFMESGAVVMVCGMADLADSVRSLIAQIIVSEYGVTHESAVNTVEKMINSGRLYLDVWGRPREMITHRLQRSPYSLSVDPFIAKASSSGSLLSH